ncbi:MAG: small ribosomal subunit Rsm22 family protein [Deltaproteobacteria bacterium]|nr:small ribosomal subunit Rsm22 family protein [Deltaproteobacteria bacterium]
MKPYRLAPLPPTFELALAQALERTVSASMLPKLVERLSRKYNGESQQLTHTEELAAWISFFLPRDLHKPVAPLAELIAADALPKRPLRILDLSAGVGTHLIGALLALEALGHTHGIASITAVEPESFALDALARVFSSLARHRCLPARTPSPERLHDPARTLSLTAHAPFDLVLLCNTLTPDASRDEESQVLTSREVLQQNLSRFRLSPDGAVLLIEPATQHAARTVQHLRTAALTPPLHVVAPCTHRQQCPLLARPRDWCHQDIATDLPAWLIETARGAGLRFQGLSYAYLTLRHEPTLLTQTQAPWVPARWVSAPRASKGKTEAFLCATRPDGAPALTEPLRAMQLDRDIPRPARDTPKVSEITRGETVAIAQEALTESPVVRLSPGSFVPIA